MIERVFSYCDSLSSADKCYSAQLDACFCAQKLSHCAVESESRLTVLHGFFVGALLTGILLRFRTLSVVVSVCAVALLLSGATVADISS